MVVLKNEYQIAAERLQVPNRTNWKCVGTRISIKEMKNLSEELITRADIAKSELMNLGTDQCKLSNTMNRERERERL